MMGWRYGRVFNLSIFCVKSLGEHIAQSVTKHNASSLILIEQYCSIDAVWLERLQLINYDVDWRVMPPSG